MALDHAWWGENDYRKVADQLNTAQKELLNELKAVGTTVSKNTIS